jgi:serine/threonine protein kinase
VILARTSGRPYSAKADVWSIGAIAYVLLSGTYAYYDSNPDVLLEQTLKQPVEFDSKAFKGVSKSAKLFVATAMLKSSKERPAASELLQHAWLQDKHLSSISLQDASHSISERKDMFKGLLGRLARKKQEQ